MTKFNLKEKREELIKDINLIHQEILHGNYISYGTLRRLLDKVKEQDKELIREFKNRLQLLGVFADMKFKIIGVDLAIYELQKLTGDLK